MPPNSWAMLSIAYAPEFQNSGAMCCHKLMPPNVYYTAGAQPHCIGSVIFFINEAALLWKTDYRWKTASTINTKVGRDRLWSMSDLRHTLTLRSKGQRTGFS